MSQSSWDKCHTSTNFTTFKATNFTAFKTSQTLRTTNITMCCNIFSLCFQRLICWFISSNTRFDSLFNNTTPNWPLLFCPALKKTDIWKNPTPLVLHRMELLITSHGFGSVFLGIKYRYNIPHLSLMQYQCVQKISPTVQQQTTPQHYFLSFDWKH